MARELLKMAIDENVSDTVKLAAIRDALDRAGLSARTAVNVAIGPKPWEQIFDHITGGSRAESRRRRSLADDDLDEWHPPGLVHADDAAPIVDAEVIEPDCTESLESSSVERASNAGRRTYSVRDFERSESGSESHRSYLAARWPGGETVGD